jgi:ABC-type transporter Mla subunit MlaD
MTLDVEGLTQAIKLCFSNARDIQHFDTQQRLEMLFQGKILRGHLVNLISARFEHSADEAVDTANKRIAAINERLKSVQETLQGFADTVDRLSNLAKDLEGLISLAAEFV